MSEHMAGHRLEEVAMGDGDAEAIAHTASCDACSAYVERLREGARAFGATRDAGAFTQKVAQVAQAQTRKSRWTRVVWMTMPIAVAAAIVFFFRTGAPSRETQFKGASIQLAAIMLHEGSQHRDTGAIHVQPGDRLRVEVSVQGDQALSAGVLEDDGTWTSLLAPSWVDGGTHFSEQAARFDRYPVSGWLLAGSPDEVKRARDTHDFSQIVMLPISSSP